MFTIEIDISDREFDPPYHHVHHTDTIKFLEQARLAYLEYLGTPNLSFAAQGLLSVVSALKVAYKRELKGGKIRVTCEGGRVVEKTLILDQRIFNEREKVAIEAQVEIMFMSAATRRAVPIPPDFRAKIETDTAADKASW